MSPFEDALEQRVYRADSERAGLARRAVIRANVDPRYHRPRHVALAVRRADAMTAPRTFAAILLFGPGAAILPFRPVSAPPARAAKVKGGVAGVPWHALPLTEANTLAALRLIEEFVMDLPTLVTTRGLAARAGLFVPLLGAPECTSAAPALRGDGQDPVAVSQPDIAAVMRAESGGQATVDNLCRATHDSPHF